MGKIKSGYAIYLQFGKKLKIPVNPEKIEIQYPSEDEEYDVLGLGKVVVQKKPGLRTISWEGFFPAERSAGYVNTGAKAPKAYVKMIEKARDEQMAGRVIISRSGAYDTNMRCVISNFQTTDQGGEPGDIYYEIELKEYRSYAPRTVQIITQTETVTTTETEATTEAQRAVETPVLRVGATVIANGKYWYDSFGSRPFGTANNLSTTITRIVEGNPYPVHIGHYGWLTADQLQITG